VSEWVGRPDYISPPRPLTSAHSCGVSFEREPHKDIRTASLVVNAYEENFCKELEAVESQQSSN
jgi:hypothetical protein